MYPTHAAIYARASEPQAEVHTIASQVVAMPVHGLPVREIGLVERMGNRCSAAATASLQLLRAYITHYPWRTLKPA
jgi:hypothetical protein